MAANAVKADNLIYHKECVPDNTVNKLAIEVNEDETCHNCGKSFEVDSDEAAAEEIDETKAEDEAKALGTPETFDPNDALR